MEIALAVLLVSCFTSVGLLAIWAATSKRHWFLRCGLLFAVVSISLLIPAYEVFVALAIQGFVVIFGVISSYRWWLQRDRQFSSRFRLASLLQAMVFVSAAAAIGTQLPSLNQTAWINVVLIGATMGIATLIGYWIARSRRLRSWRHWLVASVVIVALSILLMATDWFFISAISQGLAVSWPPEPTPGSITGVFGGPQEDDTMWAWLGVTASTTLLTVCVWPCFAANASSPRSRRYGITLLLLIASPAAIASYWLANPLPIPTDEAPNENGFGDLVAAGKLTGDWDFNDNLDGYEHAWIGELQAAVAEMDPAYQLLAEGLSRRVQFPINYQSRDTIDMYVLMNLRALARICGGRGKLAAMQHRFEDAADNYLDAVRIGSAMRANTLMVHALVGMGCAGVGKRELYEIRNKLTVEQSRSVIAELLRHELQPGDAEGFVYRDRVWTQHTMGWHGRLTQLLNDLCEPQAFFSEETFFDNCRQAQATTRLLCLELALHAYHREHGHFPKELRSLTPVYIDSLPTDPFDLNEQPPRYRAKVNSYVLYSVGKNREDDGGLDPNEDEDAEFNLWQTTGGDLQLSVLYAPEPPINTYKANDTLDFGEEPE